MDGIKNRMKHLIKDNDTDFIKIETFLQQAPLYCNLNLFCTTLSSLPNA
jgi:hypothetical protein